MRLSEEKINNLAHQIANMLEKDIDVRLLQSKNEVIATIRTIITKDLKMEDDLDEEVKGLVEKAIAESGRSNINYHQLFKLTKRHLTRERRLII